MTEIRITVEGGGSDIGSQEGFTENPIIMKSTRFYLEANDLSNEHMYE